MSKNAIALTSKNKVLSGLAVSGIAGLLVPFIFFCLTSFVMCKVDISLAMLMPMTIISITIGCFVSGFILALITGELGVIRGALVGAVLFIILAGISFLVGSKEFTFVIIVRMLTMPLAGAIGGYCGILRNAKSKKRH